jgi:hypothetical protein
MLLRSSFKKVGSNGSGISRNRSIVEIAASTPAVTIKSSFLEAAVLGVI